MTINPNNIHDINGDGVVSEEELEIAKQRWETKRKIVWICLFGIFLFGFLTFGLAFTDITEAKLKIIAEMLGWVFFSFASVIGAYFGFSSYAMRK
jgi:hypothetical protein